MSFCGTAMRSNIVAGDFSKLKPLAAGRVLPEGWLREWGQVNADGWLLMQAKNKTPLVIGTFWRRFKKVRFFWDNAPDYSAYFGDSLVRYAALLPDSKLAGMVDAWVDKILKSQDADGYIGGFIPQARWRMALEIFSDALIMEVLLQRYMQSGDRKLLAAVEKSAGCIIGHWRREGRTKNLAIYSGHGAILIRPLLQLHEITGREKYLSVSREIMDKCGRQRDYLRYYDAVRRAKSLGRPCTYDACSNQHNAVESEHVGLPAILYEHGGEQDMLRASQAAWTMLAKNHLSFDGTPHGNEGMLRTGPRENSEQCGAVEWMDAGHALLRATGMVQYADAVERAMFNGYPAPRTPDGMMVAYMHTPNQLVASQWSKPQFDDPDRLHSAQYFSTAHWPLCCNVNGPRGWAHFVESMIMLRGGTPTVVYYGPCRAAIDLPTGPVVIEVKTAYPFEDEVRVEVSPATPAAFAMEFRIPSWCSAATVKVNGKSASARPKPGTFLRIRRKWSAGDVVCIRFDVPIEIDEFKETGIREAGFAVKRGPLVFALPVKAIRKPLPKPWKKGPGKQISFELLPDPKCAWNYAMVLNHRRPGESFELVQLHAPANAKPWEHAPLGLRVRARRVLNWHIEGDAEHPLTPGLPFTPMKLAAKVETITLVPFGFTRLRMSYLPAVQR